MTAKNENQYIKISVSSLVIQTYFSFENFSSVLHFTLGQARSTFLGVTRYITILKGGGGRRGEG